ncbi:hypothetical protein F4782DRAFT_495281, partial [Xylaria castorea]
MPSNGLQEWWRAQLDAPRRTSSGPPICPCASCFDGTRHGSTVSYFPDCQTRKMHTDWLGRTRNEIPNPILLLRKNLAHWQAGRAWHRIWYLFAQMLPGQAVQAWRVIHKVKKGHKSWGYASVYDKEFLMAH